MMKQLKLSWQGNTFDCACFALKHALLMYNHHEHELRLKRLMKTHSKTGTQHYNITRAARQLGYVYKYKMHNIDAKTARVKIMSYLRAGHPVWASVPSKNGTPDCSHHAITILKYENRRFVIADSAHKHVMFSYTWTQLNDRFQNRFAFCAVKPLRHVKELQVTFID
jgi:Peptidase_C39 like family